MKIKLISHASVIVTTEDACILTDPWLDGKVFNDSWSLLFNGELDEDDLAKIDHLWISHEHPDHLHFPTLKSLPEEFKSRVTVLFQDLRAKNVVNSLRNICGFSKIIELPHREFYQLTPKTRVYCYHSRHYDSALAVESNGQTVLNINDVEVSPKDRVLFDSDLGKVDCVLNQFSIAGYWGRTDFDERIPEICQAKLNNIISDSEFLHADVTIPFASFVYFSCDDNEYINRHVNTPRLVSDAFVEKNMQLKVLKPGEEWSLGDPIDNHDALGWYDAVYENIPNMLISPSERTEIELIEKAFNARCKQLHRNFPTWFLKLVKPISIRIPDLETSVEFSIGANQMRRLENSDDIDADINSQPLWYAFKYPWGMGTLGVSGRLQHYRKFRRFTALRFLLSINNAGVKLRFKYLFSSEFIDFLRARGIGLFSQLIYRLKRARMGT